MKNKTQGSGYSLLLSQTDDYSITLIENLLKESAIPYLIKRRGVGGYFKIAFGGSYELVDIYVLKADFEKAKEITDAYFTESLNISDEEKAVESDVRGLKAAKWIIRILFITIIVLILGAAILSFVQRFLI